MNQQSHVRIIALLALAVMPVMGAAQHDLNHAIVLTSKEACLLMPAEFVAGPMVERAEWSPSGQYVLAIQNTMRFTPAVLHSLANRITPGDSKLEGEVSLVLWDAGARKSQVLWRSTHKLGWIQDFHWFAGADVALAVVGQKRELPARADPAVSFGRRSVLRIDAAAGTRETVSAIDWDPTYVSGFNVICSPAHPLAILRTYSQPQGQKHMQEVLKGVRPSGALGLPLVLPEELHWSPSDPWVEDGSFHQVYSLVLEQGKPGKRVYTYHPQTGKISETPGQPKPYAAPTKQSDLRVQSSSASIQEQGTTRPLKALWLASTRASERPRALIHADATLGILSPRCDAVLYLTNGSAWVAPIIRMPKDQFLAMLAVTDRDTALANAKQIGNALRMYSEDYDDTLPSGDQINEKIVSYLGNKVDMLTGFVYTYSGGPFRNIGDPSGTELGFVNGPGGKAIIYADGHADWRGN